MEHHDIALSRTESVDAGRENLDFFAAMAVPEVFKYQYPLFFVAVWQMLCTAALKPTGKDRYAIGIPRGFGKTMLMKLFVAWLIAYSDRKFILIVCNTAGLAENFLADVADILASDNFIRLFGNYQYTLTKDTQDLKKFSFKGRDVVLAGLGSGSSLRGLNIKYVRPDVILQDDMQSREQAGSPVESVKILSWMLGTLLKANDNERCLHIFVGNMYPYEGSILSKLQTNAAWVSLITGAILEDGESLWPQMRSVDDILSELESDTSLGHPEIFFSEVMNDPVAGSRSGVDFSKINIIRQEDTDSLAENATHGFVIVDPAGSKKKSDDTAIGACYVLEGEPILRDAVHKKMPPNEIEDTAIKMCLTHNIHTIVVEDVAFQGVMVHYLLRRLQQLGISNIQVLPINPGGVPKNSRILTALKALVASKDRIILHPSVRALVTHQITYFDPLKTNNKDDLLDILAYLRIVLVTYGNKLLRHTVYMLEEEVRATPYEDLEQQMDF